MREAPGGGRLLTPAVLYTPKAGPNVYGPAIVMLDEGPGSHPLQQGQATRFASERLAALGYTVLSLYSGQERSYSMTPFKDTAWAIRGALDYLEMSSFEDFVLVGQGYGAIAAAHYLATQPDKLMDNGGIWLSNYLSLSHDRRVVGTIYFAPTRAEVSGAASGASAPPQGQGPAHRR